MKQTLLTTPVRPNRPLRKPSSSPGLPSSTPPRFPSMTAAPPVRSAGNGKSPDNSLPGLVPPALTVYFCNFCGQQGNFRCKRCKKMPYCSAVCQTEDWKEHRHICKPIDPEPAREQPKENVALPGTGHRENIAELKKVYLKDLHASKITSGMDIQATVVEFCSPDRFYILPQDPEVLEALQIISTELQKTCSISSGTAYGPCDGEVCTVQFSVDKNWYRGLVQTVAADKKTASILYIDFGNEENVPIERIQPLPANIQHFCPCAMECRIAGVVPVVNKWSDECCITVRQMLTGKAVTVKLLEATEKEGVHAVDIVLSMRMMLSSFLIKNGFGQRETTSVPPTEQDIIAMLSASFENYKRLSDGKDDNEWAQPPEPLTQAVGDQFLVVLTHFVSPSDLVVQKVENAELIRDLQLKLRDHCAQISTPQNFRPAPGTVCCAQFSEDKQWYRAKVLAYPSEERVCVAYLDFGNSEEVDLSQLLPITPALLTIPMQAILCALAGVHPVGENWSRDCILSLQCQLSNRLLRLKIHGVQEGKTLVSMVDEASDPQVDFAELLITACYATPASDSASANLPAEETTAPAETSVPPAVPEPLVWTSAELPSDGQTVTLFTSIVESPGRFYCRLFMELEAQLKQHCEGEASPYFPKVGEPCCAPFSGSGSWCRALVNGRSGDDVGVYLVDYGHNMTAKSSHLRSITPKLLTLPFQAVCCWLAGVDPIGSEWSSEALLWFQNLLDGEQLSARVLSVTEQGYGLEVISRGQNIAAALIAEQMAKAIGVPVGAKHEQVESTTTKENGGNEQEDSVEVAGGIQTAVASESEIKFAGFPVDWKTVELPLNESFQPYVAGVISPSLFYVLGPTQIDQNKLQEVMKEVAAYCSIYQGTLSTGMKSRPSAGAACCAQFSGDKNWYRAVILEVGENELSVIYADYGNTEKVPSSQILPIPAHLLQLPFQIIRCTLAGGENFPEQWPEEVLQACRAELVNAVLAKVQSFDGFANALSLTLPAERDGVQLTSLVLDKLNAFNKTNPDTNQKLDDAPGVPDGPQSKLVPEPQLELEHKPAPVDTTGSTKPAELTIISNLEQVMQLQLALIKQLVGQIK
uniref:Tudor domain containing 1 n=1 Tax=Xiphophorus maculatus TaxID=8083 RepID=M4A0X7_XIPMA